MNLYGTIYDFLRGHNAEIAIVCSPQAVTLTPKAPIAVPTGYGFDGQLRSVTITPKDEDNVVLHLNVKGFKVEKVKTV